MASSSQQTPETITGGESRKRGRPKGSKNKNKATATVATVPSAADSQTRRPPGRPHGTGFKQREQVRLAGLGITADPVLKRGPGRPRKRVPTPTGPRVSIELGHFVSPISPYLSVTEFLLIRVDFFQDYCR